MTVQALPLGSVLAAVLCLDAEHGQPYDCACRHFSTADFMLHCSVHMSDTAAMHVSAHDMPDRIEDAIISPQMATDHIHQLILGLAPVCPPALELAIQMKPH